MIERKAYLQKDYEDVRYRWLTKDSEIGKTMGRYSSASRVKINLEKFLELNLKENNNGTTEINSNQDT